MRDVLAKLIQKYLENQPVIVLGTGATIPYGIPSMPDLAGHLKTSITDKSTEWNSFIHELDRTDDLETALHNTHLPPSLTNIIIETTWKFINQKDLDFYECLIKERVTYNPLRDLLSKLLQSHPKHVKIITTNYDRLAEYAADLAEAYICTGFSGRYLLNFNQEYLHSHPKQSRVDIWKVHGSLDWFNKNNSLYFSSPLASKIHVNTVPLIVTPGIIKYHHTHLEPFRTVMHEADRAIVQAHCFLCIGYGFNDEHVQPKLIAQVRKGRPIVTVVKNLTEAGRRLLLDTPLKSIVIEEDSSTHTRIHYFDADKHKTEIIEGRFWQLSEFLNLWL